jgi:hypothetical protein
MAALEQTVAHEGHTWGVDESIDGEVWLSWRVRGAGMHSHIPAAKARELAEALLAAADAAEEVKA